MVLLVTFTMSRRKAPHHAAKQLLIEQRMGAVLDELHTLQKSFKDLQKKQYGRGSNKDTVSAVDINAGASTSHASALNLSGVNTLAGEDSNSSTRATPPVDQPPAMIAALQFHLWPCLDSLGALQCHHHRGSVLYQLPSHLTGCHSTLI